MPTENDIADRSLVASFEVVRRRWLWVVGLVVVCVGASLAYAFTAPKQYTATAQLLVEPSTGSLALNGTQVTISSTDVVTEMQLVTSSGSVRAAVRRELGFVPRIAVSQLGQTNVIELAATNRSAVEAAKTANAFANAFVAYQHAVTINSINAAESQLQAQITSIEHQVLALQNEPSSSAVSAQITALEDQVAPLKSELGQLEVDRAAVGGVGIVSNAAIPSSPSSPKKPLDGLIGLAGGLVLGLCAAFIVDRADDSIRSQEEIERIYPDIPVMGSIPAISGWRDSGKPFVVTLAEPASQASEAYRSLRTSLQFTGLEGPIRSILLTSPSTTEGKTSTTANLAVTLAGAGRRVVMVSTDLRRPRLGAFFDKDESAGLTSVILGDQTLDDALQPVDEVPGLFLLGTGPLPPNPAEVLQSRSFDEVFEALSESFDIVLLDSPPALPVTDAVILAGRVDATLTVVAQGRTGRRQLAETLKALALAKCARGGLVLNAVKGQRTSPYYRDVSRLAYHDATSESPPSANGSVPGGEKDSGEPEDAASRRGS